MVFNILKTTKRYYIVCDECGCYRSYFDGTICLYGNKRKAKGAADFNGWLCLKNGKHYCKICRKRHEIKDDDLDDIQEGQCFHISGDSRDMWLEDYNVNVNTVARVLKTPAKKDKKVLVSLDEIDHDKNVHAYIRKSYLKRTGDKNER